MAMLRAALYCRLSKDDMLQGDSESIKTQKAMLTQYAKEHGFLVVEIYVDDGYSGLNFDRPSFNRMLDDIEAGKIDVVITKDLSRLGRDHLKVGHFTEIYFPMKNVRYIAVNDGVDTANKNNDIAALKNVMNEFYSRDNSRKIRSCEGKGGAVPFFLYPYRLPQIPRQPQQADRGRGNSVDCKTDI